jgi:divalent anion:Na+ symporter, DASS family
LFGRSSLGLAYSIVITDALIAPAFPSNTARGGVIPLCCPSPKGVDHDPMTPRDADWAAI